jgi:transposase-like protein
MSTMIEEKFKRWTPNRKVRVVLDISHGCTRVAEVSRAFDLPPSNSEEWVEDGRKGMGNALHAKPLIPRSNMGSRLASRWKPSGKRGCRCISEMSIKSRLADKDE